MAHCPTHGTYQDTTAGYCPQCGSHARLVEFRFPPVVLDPRAHVICDRCGKPKNQHTGVELFCPFYSTFRAPADRATATRQEG